MHIRVILIASVIVFSNIAFAGSWDCGKETQQAKNDCKTAMQVMYADNDALGAQGAVAAGSGGIINKGGNLQSALSQQAFDNVKNAREACLEARKQARQACSRASRQANATHAPSGTFDQIRDNWESARDYIDNRKNAMDAAITTLSADGITGGTQVSEASGLNP